MVDDQEIDPGCDRLLKRDHARVDRGANARHPPIVGHLQSVESAGRILERGPAGALIAVGNKVFESGRHRGGDSGRT